MVNEAESILLNQVSESLELAGDSMILCAEDLCLCYGDKTAIENVSLRIPVSSVTAIVGPSGSGKSSFLCCLNRLTDLTENCTVRGAVKLSGQNLYGRHMNPIEIRRRVGMLFQKPNPFPFSIRKNLALPLRNHGHKNKKIIAEKIEQALRDVYLWDEVKDRLDESALSLSGGQQQRLCLARALILEPEVVLMDEPCSALDPISSQKIENLIISLKNQYTMVIVTHNMAQARRLGDYLAVFWSIDSKGKLIEYGPAKEVFERPRQKLTEEYFRSWQ